MNRISLANFQSSTKIEALREELDRMLQRDPSGKAIVFSQFTSMLDLIAFRLQQVPSFTIPHMPNLTMLPSVTPFSFKGEMWTQLLHARPSLHRNALDGVAS